jgi:hypothetical protein
MLGMYTQVWAKYLPIIRILIKKSINEDQTLALNSIDFERAGAARKSGYKFSIQFSDGRASNVIISLPLAKDLATALLDDSVIKELFKVNDYQIDMNTKYQLSIKCTRKGESETSKPEEVNAEAVTH